MSEDRIEILLVEDNPTDVELTLYALSSNGISDRIKVIWDGAEALDFLFCNAVYSDRNPEDMPRVILLDSRLPLVDGIEVLRQVKANPATRRIPVVMLTSRDDDGAISEGYDLGANSYIVKPVDFEQFGDAVRQLRTYWAQLNEPPRGE